MMAQQRRTGQPGPRHERALEVAQLGLVGLCLLATKVTAADIPVNNPSFEILPTNGLPYGCGADCSYSVELIPGWTNVPYLGDGLSSGQFRPGTDAGNTTYFNTLSDGPTSAYTTTGCIAQTVGATVEAGVTYTLIADVGWRRDASPAGYPRIIVNNVFYDGAGTAVYGGWAPYTATYVGRPEDVGMPITICLSSVTFQGNFDNVRMTKTTATGVEPSPSGINLEVRPNPFRSKAHVYYALATRAAATLRVYDVAGRVVRTLVHADAIGSGEIVWDGADDRGVPTGPGVYLLRLTSGDASGSSRVLRLR